MDVMDWRVDILDMGGLLYFIFNYYYEHFREVEDLMTRLDCELVSWFMSLQDGLCHCGHPSLFSR